MLSSAHLIRPCRAPFIGHGREYRANCLRHFQGRYRPPDPKWFRALPARHRFSRTGLCPPPARSWQPWTRNLPPPEPQVRLVHRSQHRVAAMYRRFSQVSSESMLLHIAISFRNWFSQFPALSVPVVLRRSHGTQLSWSGPRHGRRRPTQRIAESGSTWKKGSRFCSSARRLNGDGDHPPFVS